MDAREKKAQVVLGRQAEALLEEEALSLAFKNLETKYRQEWLATGDERKQYAAWAKTHALDDVRQELRRIVNRGATAAATLQSAQ